MHSHPLIFLALLLLAACRQADAPKTTPTPPEPEFSRYAELDTATYALSLEGTQYRLQNRLNGKTYTFPEAQLMPPANDPALEPQLPLRYGPGVMAFDAGKGMIGLYLSSYEISDGGSMALAEGYDAFLMLDTTGRGLLPEVWQLGQIRGRHKFMGCMEAKYTHLYLSRPYLNDYCQIGLREEQVKMEWGGECGLPQGGPYHDIGPLKWYCFDGNKWTYNPRLDRLFPIGKGCGEFPPMSDLTPIDVALQAYRGRNMIGGE